MNNSIIQSAVNRFFSEGVFASKDVSFISNRWGEFMAVYTSFFGLTGCRDYNELCERSRSALLFAFTLDSRIAECFASAVEFQDALVLASAAASRYACAACANN